MTDRKPSSGSSFVDATLDQAKAALTKLRGYAADHSSELNSAIDKAGAFVNKQTNDKYRSKVGNVQSFARSQVNKLGRPAPDLADAHRAFGLDEPGTGAPGATAWRQPPSADRAQSTPGLNTTGSITDDIKDALAKAKKFAADHADDATRMVDKVATFVDTKTDGKYADKIAKVQQQAKVQVDKRLRDDKRTDDQLLDPLADERTVRTEGDARPAYDPLKPQGPTDVFGLDDIDRTDRPGTL